MTKKTKRQWTPIAIPLAMLLILGIWTGPALGADEITDLAITDAVEDEIIIDPAVSTTGIDVSTENGVVTLTGTVNNILAKKRAEKIAETVKGVRAVVNTINVVPPVMRSDMEIRDDIKEALLVNPATESYEVTVNVEDNVVSLEGNVASWQERELAGKIARGVSGVREVNNDISVSYKTNRTDKEIKEDVQAALNWDVLVDDALINITVNNGEVILTGTVGSAAEKSEAIRDAWVAGVTSVDAAELDVERWARDPEMRADKYRTRSDAEIKEAVTNALIADPEVFSFNIRPEVEGGVVTLRGKVTSLKSRRSAAEAVRDVVGVVSLKNRLKVRTEEPFTDQRVESRVQNALVRDPYVDRYDITVDVINGVANLYGTVDSYFEKAQADDVAARVSGVVAVDNNIAVEDVSDPYLYDPYVEDWHVYDYDWYDYQPGYTFKSDMEIKEEIESEFFWSPFVDGGDITVTVEDGKATLTGNVDSWSEYSAATENAYEGGATWVRNELDVTI
ncbi:MAG: BON domain-containing protein [Thermodesulfobacteriota bacterium]